jgi:hypothetical protein
MLLSQPAPSEADVRRILDLCVGSVVTAEEDRAPNAAGLRAQMSTGWDGRKVFARYRAAGDRSLSPSHAPCPAVIAQLPQKGWGISHDRYLGNFTRSMTRKDSGLALVSSGHSREARSLASREWDGQPGGAAVAAQGGARSAQAGSWQHVAASVDCLHRHFGRWESHDEGYRCIERLMPRRKPRRSERW